MTSAARTHDVRIQPDEALAGWQLGRVQPMPTRIPPGWELLRLTSVARLESGHTPSRRNPSYWHGDIPWISLHDSAGLEGPEIFDTAQTIGELGLANSSARLLPKGTVVFSRTATVGKATIMGREMATSQDFANYVCGSRVHNRFLMYLFRFLAPEWNRLMAGSTHNTVYMPVFRELQVLLPPLSEQQAIATALSDADALLSKLDHLIAKKRDLKQATMQQLLTGATRLPGFEGRWAVATIADLERAGRVKLARGQVISKVDIGSSPGDFPIYSSSVKSGGLFGSYGHYMFDEELITWSVDGGGHFFYRPRHKFSVTNVCGYMRVDSSRISYAFLAAQLQLLHSRKTFDYTSKAHPSVIRKAYEVQLPRLVEQAAIAAALSDMDAELASLEARREKTRAIKQGMMQELLTGKTRLV